MLRLMLLAVVLVLPLPSRTVRPASVAEPTRSACAAAETLGADRAGARAGLFERLQHPQDEVRCAAAHEVSRARTLGPEQVSWMVAALRDAHPGIRSIAATGLGRADVVGWPRVVAALVDAAVDPEQDVRWAATLALTDHFPTWPEEVLGAWTRALSDPSDDVKAIAANCIESAGPAAHAAVSALEAAMDRGPGPFLEWELSDALHAVEAR